MIFKNIKKILVFKLCCFGDLVFITPTINALKHNFPDAKITIISSSWVEKILPYMTDVDEHIIYDPPERENTMKKIKSARYLIKMLKQERFDLAFLGHRTGYFGLILFLAGIKYRFGFDVTKFINYNEHFDQTVYEPLRYLNILKKYKFEINNASPVLVQKKSRNEILGKYNIPKNKFIIGLFPFGGINPGTRMEIKRWGLENYLQLINMISNNLKEISLIVFQGKEKDETINIDLTEYNILGTQYENINLYKFDIDSDLISVCNIFISSDTGPLHIAAAFGVSTLSIFGPSDPRIVSPAQSHIYGNCISPKPAKSRQIHSYIWKEIECSPCYTPEMSIDRRNKKYWKGNSFICYKGTTACIKQISVDEVYAKLSVMIKLLNN